MSITKTSTPNQKNCLHKIREGGGGDCWS